MGIRTGVSGSWTTDTVAMVGISAGNGAPIPKAGGEILAVGEAGNGVEVPYDDGLPTGEVVEAGTVDTAGEVGEAADRTSASAAGNTIMAAGEVGGTANRALASVEILAVGKVGGADDVVLPAGEMDDKLLPALPAGSEALESEVDDEVLQAHDTDDEVLAACEVDDKVLVARDEVFAAGEADDKLLPALRADNAVLPAAEAEVVKLFPAVEVGGGALASEVDQILAACDLDDEVLAVFEVDKVLAACDKVLPVGETDDKLLPALAVGGRASKSEADEVLLARDADDEVLVARDTDKLLSALEAGGGALESEAGDEVLPARNEVLPAYDEALTACDEVLPTCDKCQDPASTSPWGSTGNVGWGLWRGRSYSRFRRTHTSSVLTRYLWTRCSHALRGLVVLAVSVTPGVVSLRLFSYALRGFVVLTRLAWVRCSRGIRHARRGLFAALLTRLAWVRCSHTPCVGSLFSRYPSRPARSLRGSSHMPCVGSLFAGSGGRSVGHGDREVGLWREIIDCVENESPDKLPRPSFIPFPPLWNHSLTRKTDTEFSRHDRTQGNTRSYSVLRPSATSKADTHNSREATR